MQPGFGIELGLTWFTGTDSFVSRSFSLLARLAILPLTSMDDSMEWQPPFEEIGLVFLNFRKLVPIGWFLS